MREFVSCLLVLSGCTLLQGEECRTTKEIYNKKYSTKTPYQYIVDTLGRKKRPADAECESLQMWNIIRHGTRYPNDHIIDVMSNGLKEFRDRILSSGKSRLCKKDLETLKNWNVSIESDDEKKLHKEGVEELIFMGERLLENYPNLFREYNQNDYLFRATDTERAQRSGQSLAVGLFSKPVANKVVFEEPIKPHDPLIRFYKVCYKWAKEVKNNNATKIEFDTFSRSSYVRDVRRNMTEMLGFKEMISLEDLEELYASCVFDQAWTPKKLSPWCSLFSKEMLDIMEYREDLKYYWRDGPGHEISYTPACVLIKNVFENFKNVTLGLQEERGIFYFTHSGTMLKFLAFLGTHQDSSHLLSENFRKMKKRKWRTSFIGPFAANIAFVLKKCNSEFSVCLLVNEKPERLPGCYSSCCPWQKFVDLFQSKIDSCDFNAICENSDEAKFDVPDDAY